MVRDLGSDLIHRVDYSGAARFHLAISTSEDTGVGGRRAGSCRITAVTGPEVFYARCLFSAKKIMIPDLSRGWYHRSDLTNQVPHCFTWPSQLHEDTAGDGDAQIHAG